jgi:CotH kinase protein
MLRLLLLVCLLCIQKMTFYAQVSFESSNLPIVIISTNGNAIEDEPKITADLQVIDNGPSVRNFLTDPPNGYQGKVGIERRGSSSQDLYEKKSYSFETRKEDGSNNNVTLLGLPKENDWILYGPYGDKSLIRDALAYTLAGQLMPYSPRFRFCEVILNNEYQGVYLLLEKIKRDENRVNIAKLGPEDNQGEAVTGGYIIKLDKGTGQNSAGWISPYRPNDNGFQETFYQYHYPELEDITVQQAYYIEDYVGDWERLMKEQAPLFNDSINGYIQYIDPATFIDFILVNELCKNVDAYRLSTFLYKDREGSEDDRLKAGPVWDFNLGFGNVDFCAGPDPQGWVLNYNNICPDDGWLIPFYWNKLMSDQRFVIALRKRWTELRQSSWTKDNIRTMIDAMTSELDEAQARNFQRWPILGQYVWPNSYIGGTYNSEIVFLKNWLMDRIDWMDGAIANYYDYIPVGAEGQTLVYPNPYLESAILEFEGQPNYFYDLYIYNALGQLVASAPITRQPARRFFVELPELQGGGVYFFSVISADKVFRSGSFRKL